MFALKIGFYLSLIAGLLILIQGIVIFALSGSTAEMFVSLMPWLATDPVLSGIAGVVLGIIVLIGAFLIGKSGKEFAGGVIVFVISVISLVTGGGWVIGAILGIVGGALGIAKK